MEKTAILTMESPAARPVDHTKNCSMPPTHYNTIIVAACPPELVCGGVSSLSLYTAVSSSSSYFTQALYCIVYTAPQTHAAPYQIDGNNTAD